MTDCSIQKLHAVMPSDSHDTCINSLPHGKSFTEGLHCTCFQPYYYTNTLHYFCEHNQTVYAKLTWISHSGSGTEHPSQKQTSVVLHIVARFPKGCSSNSLILKKHPLHICLHLFLYCCQYMCLCAQIMSCISKNREKEHKENVCYMSTCI